MLMATPATVFFPDYRHQRVVGDARLAELEKADLEFLQNNEDEESRKLLGFAKKLEAAVDVKLELSEEEFSESRDKLISETRASVFIDDSDSAEYERVVKSTEKEVDWATDKPRWKHRLANSQFSEAVNFKDADEDDEAEVKEKIQTTARAFQGLPEVGKALDPLFGAVGPALFFLGVFSAAYSSFLVNSMIGGFILADGLGIGDKPEDKWPRIFTVVVLLTGMFVGLYCIIVLQEQRPVQLIVAAQAVTVVASPLVAGSLLWLTSKKDVMGDDVNGRFVTGLGIAGLILLLAMSARTLMGILGS